jgi:hypothetical protein
LAKLNWPITICLLIHLPLPSTISL